MSEAGGLGFMVGGTPFGSLLPGLRERVRPIYMQKGILPEIAEGVSAATQLTAPPER